MADRKKFRTLLVKFGNIFVDEQFLWLRFLLCEALEHVALVADNDDIAINLLNKIVTNGKLKINDVSLLRKIAELVNIHDAKDLISDYIKNVPQVQPEYRLSAERAAFFNAIMAFDRQKSTDKKKVIGYYELRRKFDTEWDLVLHLEMNQWATMSWQEISKDIFHLINGKAQKCLASVGLAPREDAEDMGRNSPDTVVASANRDQRVSPVSDGLVASSRKRKGKQLTASSSSSRPDDPDAMDGLVTSKRKFASSKRKKGKIEDRS